MYISLPIIVVLVLVMLGIRSKQKRTEKALSDLLTAVEEVYQANALHVRSRLIADIYDQIADIGDKADLRAAHELVTMALDNPKDFAELYDIRTPQYSFKFGMAGKPFRDILWFLANSDTEILKHRQTVLARDGYKDSDILTSRFKDKL